MTMWRATAKLGFTSPIVGATIALSILALIFGFIPLCLATSAENRTNSMEEEIWKLEEAYFTNLYRANYEGVLALVHPRFLGWPGNLPKPIGRDESAEFMKRLIPQPTPCIIRIERAGLRKSGDTVLTQYTLHVDCPTTSGMVRTKSSLITHTWTRQKGQWKLLGGMSVDLNKE
ncbi:MAG: nuclear transport factor 2 family protein [Candidatus Hadarchaeum sp.]